MRARRNRTPRLYGHARAGTTQGWPGGAVACPPASQGSAGHQGCMRPSSRCTAELAVAAISSLKGGTGPTERLQEDWPHPCRKPDHGLVVGDRAMPTYLGQHRSVGDGPALEKQVPGFLLDEHSRAVVAIGLGADRNEDDQPSTPGRSNAGSPPRALLAGDHLRQHPDLGRTPSSASRHTRSVIPDRWAAGHVPITRVSPEKGPSAL
jgi:hypothetical protein